MKKLIFILITILIGNEIFASELIFKPEKAKIGDTINVFYSGNQRFDNKKSIDLVYYVFDENSSFPKGYETNLIKNNDNWQGKFVVPQNSVYILFKIFVAQDNIDIIDNNFGNYWDLLIYDGAKPLRNAYLKSALTRLGSISSNIDRIPNFYEAIKNLENELANYPDNISAELGLVTTLFDMKKISNDEFNKRIKEISKTKINENNENDIRAISKSLSAINEKKKAEELEQNFATKFPNSSIAEDLMISKISNTDNFKDFSNFCINFFKKFPNSINNDRIFTAFSTAYLQQNKVDALINILDSLPNSPAYIYSRIAKNLFEFYKKQNKIINPETKNYLLSLVNKSEEKSNNFKNNTQNQNFSIYSKGELEDIIDVQIATIYEIKAELLKEFEPVNAVPYFEQSIELYRNNVNSNIYENFISLLISLGDSLKALKNAEDAIIKNKSSENIFEFHSDLSRRIYNLNDSTYLLKLDSIEQKRNLYLREIFQNELLKIDNFDFSLETLDGTLVEKRDIKNKISIFNFFSSWCEPCKAMIPAYNMLNDELLEDELVELVAVNVWENNRYTNEEFKKFIKQNDILYPVARDNFDIFPRQIGITGLPTIAILDKNSNIRFIIRGFSNNESLINDILARVDFLLNYLD